MKLYHFTCLRGQWTFFFFDIPYHHQNLLLVVPPQWETVFLSKLSLYHTVTFGSSEGVVIWWEDSTVTLGKVYFMFSLVYFLYHKQSSIFFRSDQCEHGCLCTTEAFLRDQPRSSSSINYLHIPGLDL